VTQPPSPGGVGAPGSVPVCPRHPDRESYVRCQRCDRPTCPECQRPAAVGIQCVDCVRNQARGARPARTVFGGVASGGSDRPVVTIGIIAICVVVYLLQIVPNSSVTEDYKFAPAYAVSEPWRMLTSAFLHSPDLPLHILFNMYALWMVGPYLEQLFGRARYLALYLICALGGSVGYLLLSSPDNGSQWFGGAVGASGAVFGLFGAFFIVQRRLNRDTGGVIAVLVVNFALGFLPNVAWQAHVGGLVTGLLATAALAYAPRANRTAVQAGSLAAVLVLLGVLFALKVSSLPSGCAANDPPAFPQLCISLGTSSTHVIPPL
jgi:membrane associated rhomboid family serine protease